MNLGIIWPIEKYTLSTRLSEEEIVKRIRENVELNPTLWYERLEGKSDKPYEGWIQGREFKITRISELTRDNKKRGSATTPMVTGQISPFEGYAWINIDMRPESGSLFFYGVFCVALVLASITIIVYLWALTANRYYLHHMDLSAGQIFPLLLIMVAPFAMNRQYRLEMSKAKEFLSTLLEGDKD